MITVTQGNHAINAPVNLASNTPLDVATSGGTLAIGGDISETPTAGDSLELDGPGELILSGSNNYTGGTFVNPYDYQAATLIVSSSTALPPGAT